ncbi:hypothetical protein ACWCKO_00285 [Bacillus thuringiensis serovar darmstadiensis]|uniref:hypothetical protein n=1 Tax=Bacillus thuringiensis TaxID=1428 RepID=UPI00299F7ED9|nr:hypothetical protein [Bacillus thuringiensis]
MRLEDVLGVDKLENSVEFFYVCLVGKYLKHKGHNLSLENVDVSAFKDTIQHSRYYTYFLYAVENGYVNDVAIDLPPFEEDEHELYGDLYLNSLAEVQPYFYKIEGEQNEKLYINLSDTNVNNQLFLSSQHESVVIEMTAFLHVEGYLNGKRYELYPSIYNVTRDKPQGIVALYYLMMSPLTRQIIKFPLETRYLNSVSYNCWYFLGKEQGLLSTEGYTIPQKQACLQNDKYKVGNVVYFYERNTTDKSSKERKVMHCCIAIVRGNTPTSIRLEKVVVNQTRVQKDREFEKQPKDMQELWQHTDLEVRRPSEEFNLTSIGVEYVMSNDPLYYEKYFITPVYDSNEIELYVEQSGIEFTYLMSQIDAVYWVLKDWDIPFDEELYVNTYYKQGNIPLYEKDLLDGFSVDF